MVCKLFANYFAIIALQSIRLIYYSLHPDTMSNPKNTAKKELKDLLDYGWSEAEAKEIMAERAEYATRQRLLSRIAELEAFDTTEFGEMKDSARCNALLTCEENRLPRDEDSIAYFEFYASSLACVFSDNGIAF